MKDTKNGEDIDPRNVIADDQIVSIDADVIEGSLNLPPRWQHQIKDAIVAADPMLCKPAQSEDHARAEA